MKTDRKMPADAIRLTLLYLRVGTMNELQYRANFFIQLVQSVLALGTGLVVLALVFERTEELAGWSRPQLLAVLGVFTVMGGIIRSVIQPNMQRLLEEIRLGTLDYLLLKPEDAQLLTSIRDVRIWQAVDVLVGGTVLVAAVAQLETRVGWLQVMSFLALLALGAVTIYCFWLLMASAGFWLVRMDEVQELFTGVYRAAAYPIGIYPGWLRVGLTFLVPLAFAVTVPAEAITGRLGRGTVALALAVTAVLVLVSRRVFRMGLRRYSGASA